jgi:transposase
MSRKRFSVEFKEQAVRLVRDSQGKKSLTAIARDLGVTVSGLSKWVREAERAEAAGMSPGSRRALEEENRRLRRELDQVKEEREILKKAAAFFAKENR